MPGSKGLKLTGQLGDVMRESAEAAHSYRAVAGGRDLGIPKDFFDKHDIHIHVPAGAVPKDGPSAGVTMVTAIASVVTGRSVRHDVAMTGEITLGERPADRWAEGEGAGGQSGRDHHRHPAEAERG